MQPTIRYQMACIISAVCTASMVWISSADAADVFEPDNSAGFVQLQIEPGHPPLVRDLEAIGGVADQDWIALWLRSYRSYEARLTNAQFSSVVLFERWDSNGAAKLQDDMTIANESTTGMPRSHLRWETGNLVNLHFNFLRIMGLNSATAAGSSYSLQFRETTLFCPRFNNANSQVSVLIIQASATGMNACNFSAHFFSETPGSLLASQAGSLSFATAAAAGERTKVYALPGISGLAGQKGAAQIAHTCGYGGLKAKLVALEPATGFSFDTPCTMREQ